MAGAVGDTASRARSFRDVVAIFEQLKYPQRLSPSDLKMVEIARRKAGG